MIHQPWGGVQGAAEDISRQATEILRLRDKINALLSGHCHQPIERIVKDTDRDYFMAAEDAKSYGLIDEVVVGKLPK
jgi:ATP-dependent Clp protease protease subunit